MANRVVTIDGPSASGKSTVARNVAAGLGYVYVDSGSLYRAVTWEALREGVDPNDRVALADVTARMDVEFSQADGAMVFSVGGITPGLELRSEAVNESVSGVSTVPQVRKKIVSWLRGMRSFGNIVMEGRDIGTAVFPDAEFKFYLDASLEERARRRHAELAEQLSGSDVADVQGSLERRDAIDSGREEDPLRIAEGAVVIDTTSLSIEEVADRVLDAIRNG